MNPTPESSPSGGFITVSEIEAGIPEQYRWFFLIDAAPVPRGMHLLIDAFWASVKCICPAVSLYAPIHIIFGTAPFRMNLDNGVLMFTPRDPQIINIRVQNMVLLDCNKMMPYPYAIQVACILEELVHGIMHISDEVLVKRVVCELYSGVRLSNGKYQPVV